MRKLFDAEGKEVEVPDEAEIEALKKAEEDLKAFNEGKGVKNLREVLSRRDEELEVARKAKQELEAKLAERGEDETKAPEVLSPEKIQELIQQGIHGSMVGVEVQKALSQYSEEDRKVVKRYYDKLSNGESVDINNVSTFLDEAARFAFPDATDRTSRVSHGGKAARGKDEEKTFGDTDEGKDFAARMGLNISAPKEKTE